MAEPPNLKVREALLAEVRKAAATRNKTVEEALRDTLRAQVRDREWTAMIEEARERTARLGIREEGVNHLIAQSRHQQREHGQ